MYDAAVRTPALVHRYPRPPPTKNNDYLRAVLDGLQVRGPAQPSVMSFPNHYRQCDNHLLQARAA